MRVIIDMQGCQSSNANREIGRYSMDLVSEIVKSRGENDVYLMLNNLLPEYIAFIKDHFSKLMPLNNICVWQSLYSGLDCTDDRKREMAEKTREAYIFSLHPDVLLVTSLFEGLSDNAVTSIARFTNKIPTAVILYDLMPLIHKDEHFKDELAKKWYLEKIQHLKKADLLLAVSEISRQDAINYLGFSDSQVINISTSCDDNLIQSAINNEQYEPKRFEKSSHPLSANSTWAAFETGLTSKKIAAGLELMLNNKGLAKKRLAYLSPLPAVNSGISHYSAELLPELSKYYDIVIINAQQEEITDPWINEYCEIHDVDWFRKHAEDYDRVLYHFGNSEYHGHMFSLISEIPGIVVLHDFFLSGILSNQVGSAGITPHTWSNELLHSHGWRAVKERYTALNASEVVYQYPCNLSLLQESLGVIVHSDHSRRLAVDFYGQEAADNWALIPLMRVAPKEINRANVRERFGFSDSDFIVCSFGLLGPTKLNHRLLSAWLLSPMAMDPACKLIFVGENDRNKYGQTLFDRIKAHEQNNVQITGWVENEAYKSWLSAADAAVQLRTSSRGETSAAVLDCMNYGLATIVNANGSMAELPEDVVCRLNDEFTDAQLAESLTILYRDRIKRNELGCSAMKYVHENNNPAKCAELYAKAIEHFHDDYLGSSLKLIDDFSGYIEGNIADELPHLSMVLAKNFPPAPRNKQLFIDISGLVNADVNNGTQRATQALLEQFLCNPPKGYSVEPVYATTISNGYYYAREFTCKFLDISSYWTEDQPIDAWSGDIFLALQSQQLIMSAQKEYLTDCSRRGIGMYFVVHDELPVQHPDFFVDGASATFNSWLETLTIFNGVICTSKTAAHELNEWVTKSDCIKDTKFSVNWFYPGVNLNAQMAPIDIPKKGSELLAQFRLRHTFLMVGRLATLKEYSQIIAAFEQLWMQGIDVNLVIVAKQGGTVASLVKEFRSHAELNQRLFLLEGIGDEFLEDLYQACNCLISADRGEYFDLSLIEAARHQLPIIARDTPVFREIAGDNAVYFAGSAASELAIVVLDWLKLDNVNNIPDSGKIVWQTWEQSAQQLLDVLFTANEELMN